MASQIRHLGLWVNPDFKPKPELDRDKLIAQMAELKTIEKLKDPQDLKETLLRSFTKFYEEYEVEELLEEAHALGVV